MQTEPRLFFSEKSRLFVGIWQSEFVEPEVGRKVQYLKTVKGCRDWATTVY